jgi:hypothetical protein
VRAERGKENPPTSISLSTPEMEKRVYKGRDHDLEKDPIHHSHRQNISSATNSPPLLHQPPRTLRKKDKKRMHTMSKLLEKDKAVIN